MYKLNNYSYSNAEPWNIPLQNRIKNIFAAKKRGLKVVVYLYENADTSTFRYRVYNMCQSLELSLEWRGTYFFKDELATVESYIRNFDCAIVVRFRWELELEKFINKIRANHIPVGFDVDDLVYNTNYLQTVMNTLSVDFKNDLNYDYWFSYIGRIGKSIHSCDFLITTNDYIGDKMRSDIGLPVYIVPNYMNHLQLAASDFYYRQKLELYSRKNFIIGYFSGTPSHINDFLIVAPEVKKLLDMFDNIKLRIVGFMELPLYFQEYVDEGRIERVPLQNFIDLQKCIAEVDVNIVPLVNNEFSNCKSELKFFEAAAVGTITCATPSYVFRNVILNGKNGFLCEPGEWYDTLKTIIQSQRLRMASIVKEARATALNRYAYYNQVCLLDGVLNCIESKFGGIGNEL